MKPHGSTTHAPPRMPPVLPPRRLPRELLPWSAALGLVVAGLILHYFNPTEHRFYPVCMLHALTGLNCPGCGALRALHHLTHGEFAAAFYCNPLLIAALPVAFLALMRWLIYGRHQPPPTAIFTRPAVIWTTLAVIVAFSVLRNLPFPVFAWMSP
ncbi:MAG: DUF2752 domain-containing protein [Verrucomicrobiota bacterium]